MKQTHTLIMHHGLNGQPETTIEVTRPHLRLPQPLKTAMLLLTLIMGWGGSAVADTENDIWTGNATNTWVNLSSDKFNGCNVSTDVLRLYTTDGAISSFCTQWSQNVLNSGATTMPSGYYNLDLACYQIPLTDFVSDFIAKIGNQGGLNLYVVDGHYLTRISIATPTTATDPFINSTSPNAKGNGTKEVAEDTTHPTWESFSLSELTTNNTGATAFSALGDIKYIRVYVKEGNSSVDYNSHVNGQTADLLQVSAGTAVTVAPAAAAGETADPKNGLNVYNGGTAALNLNDITVTLNAGENHLKDYKIIVLLSTNALTNEGNEPTWDFEYTYTFTYPSNAVVVPFSLEDANSVSVNLNIQSHILSDLGVSSVGDIASNLYSRWYVQHKTTKEKQPLTVVDSNPSQGSTWLLQVPSTYDWPLVDGNYVHFYTGLHRSATEISGWAFSDYLGKVTVFAPNTPGTNISDYSDYQIVCEVSGHYTALDGSVPDPDVMYVWSIVPNVQFEGEANTNAVSDATGTQKVNAAAASVSLDLTGTGMALAHSKVANADVKYARFYLTDASGTIVDPTGKLEVKYNGTTVTANCPRTNQGFYVYTGNTLDKTKFTVTLTAPNAYTSYKVVALFAVDPLQNINTTGTTVEEEPDYDLLYTYSFEEYQFEYTGTIANIEAITQQLVDRTAASEQEVTLDWALISSQPSPVKYARFYVVDSSNQPVDPTQAAHQLTITGATGTACTPATLGYYVYTGSDLTLSGITVKLSSNESVLPYKVVCKLATAETNIESVGTTVYEEPDLNYQYTYSFVKPDPTTQSLTGTIAWSSAMTADASTSNIATEWQTSWSELSQGYYVRWYVVDDSDNRQALASGSSAQSGTWVFSQNGYSVSSNEAVKSGSGDFTENNWNDTWGKPTIYAPSDATYAALHGYKVICEVAATSTSTPFARYTFSFTKDFLGSEKSGITTNTLTETLTNATDVSCTLSNVTIPSGTKYARFFLTDGSGTIVSPSGKLSVTGSTAVTATGYTDYGYYIYNESGITAPTVTLTLSDATLNQYKVVMVTSQDNAVTESGVVVNEPDYDTQTTWTFKYPVQYTAATGNVEWSSASMAVTLDIDALKGSGYKASLGTNYHVVWTVEDNGTAQNLELGNTRQSGKWTYSIDGDNATFYAPTGQTFADMADIRIIASLYETATGEDPNDLSLTYTVSIVRSQFLGQLKSTGTTSSETKTIDENTTIPVTVQLGNALSGCSGAKYARVWLTQNGTAVDPTGKLTVTGMTAFGTNHDVTYGYYLYNADGITLSDATLTLAALSDYTQYQVHVALSVDAPISYGDFARAGGPLRAPADAYEPDYDYEYTISFQDSSMKIVKLYVQASDGAQHGNDYSANLQSRITSAFTELGITLNATDCFARWDVVKDGNYITLAESYADNNTIWIQYGDNNYRHVANSYFQYIYSNGTNSWEISSLSNTLNATIHYGNGVKQLGSVLECWVTDTNSHNPADPAGGYKVKVEVHFTDDGLAPDDFPGTFSGTETAFTHEMAFTETSTQITFSPTTTGAKYARYYLVKNGEELSVSSTAITLASGNGQTSSQRPKRGVYVYNASGLTADDLKVTVSLPAGSFEDYQLVAVFSDDAPTLSGTDITKEPSPLDEKQVYSFEYTTQTIHKYIAWNTNSTTIDLATLLATDLPTLTSSSTQGYVSWSVYNGPYGSSSPVTLNGSHYNAVGLWAFSASNDGGWYTHDSATSFSLSDGQLSNNWSYLTNPTVWAPNTDLFEQYRNYVIVAEASDVSSTKIRVRYIFHFTEDGEAPFALINETEIAADRRIVPVTTFNSANRYLDLTDALATGAKYVRVYMTKQGKYDETNINNLQITYDGSSTDVVQCEQTKYGYYLSLADGIDMSKLKVRVNLSGDEVLKYNVVMVSADTPLTGDQEPAWQKKTVYTFQKEVKLRINSSDQTVIPSINLQGDILQRIDAQVSDFSNSLFARWYIESPTGVKQAVAGGNTASSAYWSFDIMHSGLESWQNEANVLKFYTGMPVNNATMTPDQIEEKENWHVGWSQQVAKTTAIYVKIPGDLSTYVGYKIIFEFTDEYDTSANGANPDNNYKLRYVMTITDPNSFEGNKNTGGEEDAHVQTVNDRTAASVTVDLAPSFAHNKLSGDVKYARFYLVDATDPDGSAIDPTGLLTVTYADGTVTPCNVPEQGFYIYPGAEGVINKQNITVTLAAPQAYKCYKVVALFSTELSEVIPDDFTTPLQREPDWDQKCTYSFKYPEPTTNVIEITIPWSKTGMKLDASTTDAENEWGISFEELSAGQNVKWYVERVTTNRWGQTTITRQELERGAERVNNTWVIKPASAYTVDEANNEATLTNRADFTEANWNGVWSTPTFYAPANQNYNDLYSYNYFTGNRITTRIICELADENASNTTPYVRYIFTMTKFLGDLKDGGTEDGETIMIEDREATSVTLNLNDVFTKYKSLAGHANDKVVYARVWLTLSDGTMVDPSELGAPNGLVWEQIYTPEGQNVSYNQVAAFTNNSKYGYYFCSSDVGTWNQGILGLDEDATLTLPVGTFPQYQLHVALSITDPSGMWYNGAHSRWEYNIPAQLHQDSSTLDGDASEPDYDYLYTFNFDYGFEAKNINAVKTKYKTAIYNEDTRQFKPLLFQNWLEVAADCDVTKEGLANNGYARWYLEDLEGNRIQIEELISNQPYTSLNNPYGYYRYKFDVNRFGDNRGLTDTGYDPTITLPAGYNYNEVRLVCVVTTLTEPQTDNPNLPVDIPAQEPRLMQVKYIYNLVPLSEFANQPFVHYQGESYKYLTQMGRTDEATERDYIIVDGTAGATELSWDYEHSVISTENFGNIRQNVHTVHYYVYFDPNDAQDKTLMLPSQYYFGDGNDTEPRAYYRWYDWKTDMKASSLSIHGSELHLYPNKPELTEEQTSNPSRGFFAMLLRGKNDLSPCDANIGVRFNAPADWDSEILVACDVSRYLDGMDDSFTYLMHEPTLSVRYIYHIIPAPQIADDIADAAKTTIDGTTYTGLAAVEQNLLAGEDTELYEYNGRTVVSLNGTTGTFTMRSDLQQLSSYWVWTDAARTNLLNVPQMQWYAYYVDENGDVWKHTVYMGLERATNRLGLYELSDMSGTYTKVGGSDTKEISATDLLGDRLYMIGCMGDGAHDWIPVVWNELNFIDARPLELGTEGDVPERTDQYMRSEYTLAQVLDFNDLFHDEATRFSKPTASYENYATVPLVFPDAQYGFCYPQLYGLCGTNKFAGWGEYGISPTHGDYTLLKSMNMPGVSQDNSFDDQSLNSQWWWGTLLFDVTHERAANGKNITDTNDYGTFLYVDASDEARVIAELEFDAALCADAEIFYTAYVADMTDNITRPQVRFRVSTDVDGKRVPVVTFETGNIVSEGATTGYWHQVYGYTVLPSRLHNILNGTTRHYYVSVENSCENTNGADYCVDQISFYTYQAQVKAKISSDICDEGPVKVKIYAEAEQLLDMLHLLAPNASTKDMFYCLIERSDDLNHELHAEDILTGNGIYTDQSGNNNNNEYGVVTVPLNVDLETITDATLQQGTKANSGFFRDADGTVYFQLDEKTFDLEPGKKYFVSIYNLEYNRVSAITEWGNPYSGNACSVYSNNLTPNRIHMELSVEGVVSDGHIDFGCNATSVTKIFDLAVNYPSGDGFEMYTFFYYDFYKGTKAAFNAIKDENDLYLSEALEELRSKVNTAIATSDDLPTEYDEEYTQAMHDLIKTYMDNGDLFLLASNKFERTFTDPGIETYAAIPLTKEIPTGGEICSPIEFSFDIDAASGGPEILLGFDDVDYPEGYIRTVRVGLEQLSKMVTKTETVSNYMLHIPISSYHNKGNVMNSKLYFENVVLNLVDTNDPTIEKNNDGDLTSTIQVAQIKVPEHIGTGRAYVGPDRMFLPIDFSSCELTFHEGYWYEVSTTFVDEEDDGAANPCRGDLFFIIKVVPEFVTWASVEIMSHDSGVDTPTGYYNANWYNDQNWQRSVRSDLYKDAVATRNQNTSTLGHPDGYEDDSEIAAALTGNPGFVPMKFTYVTLLSGNHAPSLIKEPKVSTSTSQQGGGLLDPNQTRMLTDPSPYTNQVSSQPTENIRYDMLVRYGAHSEGGEGCFGHRLMTINQAGKYVWVNDPRSEEQMTQFNTDRKAFDVEKFYGNICKEIYFKPGAELLRQQRLSYNRAWVEKELGSNKWYLVASPLKDTYAGDMYVPVTMTDVSTNETVAGRQATEAFQPINFNIAAVNANADHTMTSQPAYSRTKYPIYQRSWNTDGAKVYTRTNDARATDYSANLGYTEVTSVATEWSHTYNDVQVPYTTLTGFSIRPHKKDQTNNTLIRLPKADTQYDYYQWDNTSPADGKLTHEVSRTTTAPTSYPLPSCYPNGITDNYRMVIDDPVADGLLTVSISDLQQQDGYILVGNPCMASLRMDEFFRGNPGLAPIYWTYEGSVASAALAMPEDITATGDDNADGIIRPLQAFFVKKKTELEEGETEATTITFTRGMTIDGNFPAVPSVGDGDESPSRGLTLCAANTEGESRAVVRLSDDANDGYHEGEDVETLFDSNLSGVPMVFTIADGQAVSIDQRPMLDLVSFGVTCSSNDPIDVQVTAHLLPLTSHLYFIDALTGEQTEVEEGSTVSVQPNDYGRYFLTTTSRVEELQQSQENVIISVRHQEVTVTATSPLSLVRATTLDGKAAFVGNGLGTQCQFQLAKGVYIIQARSTGGTQRQLKVVVE